MKNKNKSRFHIDNHRYGCWLTKQSICNNLLGLIVIGGGLLPVSAVLAAPVSDWTTVVNNGYLAPGSLTDKFFSYNQPSINEAGLVAFRARAKAPTGGGGGGGGAGEPVRGTFTRDMSTAGTPIVPLAVNNTTLVPAPNNQGSTFTEFPAFPRIDAKSNTVAFRGQSQPVYEYVTGTDPVTGLPLTTKAGTSGVYTNPNGGALVTGASQLGVVPGLSYFQVPTASDVLPGTKFDQFPGAPSPDGNLVTFKGNFTNKDGIGQTGVYYRDVASNGGTSPVVEIARSGMAIPSDAIPAGYAGSGTFGSTAPPSAADGKMVFTGLDVEEAPEAGGIFMADLAPDATLITVAGFNTVVPNNGTETLKAFGEGLSFDGRYVGFWGGWGTETFSKTVTCATDGNPDVVAACFSQDNNGTPNDGIYTFDVLKNQGIFLADTTTGTLSLAAETGDMFEDFLFWTFSGRPPGAGESEEGDAEPPRWRSSAFVAIDGDNVVFKALNKSGETGLYAGLDVDDIDYIGPITLLETGMDGGLVDPLAAGLPIATLGIERDGFRNGKLAINASMTDGENSWAGIYVAPVPEPGILGLLGLGALVLPWGRRHNIGV